VCVFSSLPYKFLLRACVSFNLKIKYSYRNLHCTKTTKVLREEPFLFRTTGVRCVDVNQCVVCSLRKLNGIKMEGSRTWNNGKTRVVC
jgi:hypothetical protein